MSSRTKRGWRAQCAHSPTETLDLIEARMRKIAETTAAAYDCAVDIHFQSKLSTDYQQRREARFAASVMKEIVGAENVDDAVEPTMGAEDFSFMLLEKPGCYAFLGTATAATEIRGTAPDLVCSKREL